MKYDLLLVHDVLDHPHFTWGSGNLVQAADRREYGPLLEFVRS